MVWLALLSYFELHQSALRAWTQDELLPLSEALVRQLILLDTLLGTP